VRFPSECYQMYQCIAQYFPNLRPAQQRGLALWVYGTILAQSATQSAVIAALLTLGRANTIRQYLREWLYDGSHKAAPCKTQVQVSGCFAPLLRWILSWWQGRQLALAIDTTMHGDKVAALVVSVLYRGCAIPVAWCILPANKKSPWIEPLMELLSSLAPAVGPDLEVVVMTDRGLWSPRLWSAIRQYGWSPLMRLKRNTVFQPLAGCRNQALSLVPGPGHAWMGPGTAFKAKGVRRFGTLIVMWDEGQKEPWVILTDLPVHRDAVVWYGLRFWIELGFRALKGVGLHWERTRRYSPDRVARHWLTLAVATLWILAYGTRLEQAEAVGREPSRLRRSTPHPWKPRQTSVFARGLLGIKQRLLRNGLWRRLWLAPEPWPTASATLNVVLHQPTLPDAIL
jgi:hypothetical protein